MNDELKTTMQIKISLTMPFPFLALFFPLLFFTLNLSAEETSADAAPTAFEERLLTDWLYQDIGLDHSSVFADSEGCGAEKALVERVIVSARQEESERDGAVLPETREALAAVTNEANRLVDEKIPGNDPRWKALYRRACAVRRVSRLAVLTESVERFVYAKHYVLGGSHYAYTEDVTDAQFVERLDRRPGASLCVAVLGKDGSVVNETLLTSEKGTIRDPDVSYDGKKIVFSKRDNFDADDFHLFDYNLETKEIRRLTDGLGFADVEPAYLPDGSILFGSTRCVQVTDCWWTEAANLYACDADGRFPRRITFDQVTVNYPQVTSDGRVLYTRWDYNDRGQIYPQGLFVMNADGTGQTAFYGNNSWFPTTILHAREIPNSGGKVLAVASGHHTRQRGKLLLIDRAHGTEENQGCRLIAPPRETKAEHIDQYGQSGEQFQYPYPIDEENFLAAYRPEEVRYENHHEVYDPPFGIYWFAPDGRRELLVWDPAISSGQPVPLAAREKPSTRPSTVDDSVSTGRYYVQDVYHGPGLTGVERGTVKRLRIVSPEFRAAGIGSNGNRGPAGGAMVATPVGVNNASWDVKRVIGEVPVEADGSAYFEVPARIPLYFQLLDEQGDVVQTMRSWSTLQPNEFFGCVGCHEPKQSVIDNVSSLTTGNQTLALQKGIARPEPVLRTERGIAENWGFSFMRDLQPILDERCVSCHTGGERADGQPAPFSLRADDFILSESEKSARKQNPHRTFSQAYVQLTGNGQFGKYVQPINIQESPAMLPPYAAGAAKSRLISLLHAPDENHKNLGLEESEIQKFALWIDLLVPYCGDYWEAADWSLSQRAEYAYYSHKRDAMTELDRKSRAKIFDDGAYVGFGREAKKEFMERYGKEPLDVMTKRHGAENTPRDVALNPNDVQGAVRNYPHAESNSEYAYAERFAAKNVLRGEKNREGEESFCWSPYRRSDLFLSVDFGHDVLINRLRIRLADDETHDGFFRRARLEFSDGSSEVLEFTASGEFQSFDFSERSVRSLRLDAFECEPPLARCGIERIEVIGITKE